MTLTCKEHSLSSPDQYCVLVDADILLELVINRGSFAEEAEHLFDRLEKLPMLNLYLTDRAFRRIEFEQDNIEHALETADYFRECFVDNIIKVKKSTLFRARQLELPDFDSAVEYICAEDNRLNAIITQNPSNFPGAAIPIWSIGELREELNSDGLSVSSIGKTVREKYQACDESFAKVIKERSIFITCDVGLRQYGLERKYDAAFIINEVYIRTVEALSRGLSIDNWPGWMRLTSRDIIRELYCAENKRVSPTAIKSEIVNNSNSDVDWDSQEQRTIEQQQMRQAFLMLSHLEQDILYLKVVKELSWNEVREALVKSGYPAFSPNSLSQRKRRALKKLRESYKTISV